MVQLALVALFCLISQVHSTAEDYNCTTQGTGGSMVLAPSATICSNVASQDACKQLFGDTTPTEGAVAGDPPATSRPTKCFTVGAAISPEIKQAAITSCPKYCGYCCATPEYNCKDAPNGRLVCSQITPAMCKDPQWREVIAQDCPSACGFCALGGCIDAAVDCAAQPTICGNPSLSSFTSVYCKRTCGLCAGSSLGSTTMFPGGLGTCGDNAANCAAWLRNGFCTSSYYTMQQKMRYCGNSCGLCNGALGGMGVTQSIFG